MPSLDQIETGYEPRYDFVAPAPQPTTPYLLASVPRTGSTWLSHLLWGTGCLGAPLEYLNFDPAGPYGFAHDRPKAQSTLWRDVVAKRTSSNGVFGVKCFPGQLQWLQQRNMPLLAALFRTLLHQPPRRVIWLGRRDRTAHVISYARALLSGVWRWEQEEGGRPEPAFSGAALARAERMLEDEERNWEAMFADMAITPLRLWYEDIVADPDATVAAVARHLGVALDPAARVAVPEIRKQAAEGARAWAEAARSRNGETSG
jgi:LPS sulfotransferase NodH